MDDSEKHWLGTGSTPKEAVLELVPTPDEEDIAFTEGLLAFSDRADPSDYEEPFKSQVTIIYESKHPEQWLISVSPKDTHWEAFVMGTKKI